MPCDKPVLLYGAGREARSTIEFLQRTEPGLKIYVTVDDGEAVLQGATFLPPVELPRATANRLFGTIVKSPGVSLYKPIFEAATRAGITVTSNINLWGEAYREGRRVIAVTGTKGKSTTATLIHQMLVRAGIDAGLAGNVGLAPLDIADRHQTVVFELSSYQTADLDFAPDIAVVTTLYPEHVDWHGSKDRYFADKLNLLRIEPLARVALGAQAATVPLVNQYLGDPARLLAGLDPELEDRIVDLLPQTRLKGQHNLDNALLAAQVAGACDVGADAILEAIADFEPLPHRLQEHRFGDLLFVDDSISTTPEATKAALGAYHDRNIALIAGGFDRDQDYEELARTIAASPVSVVACLPVTGRRLATSIARQAPRVTVIEAADLEDAMRSLANRTRQFDTIILSPGAPSYNQFRNFEERGRAFVALAGEIFA